MSNHHYNPHLKKISRDLRNDSTPAEIRLWCELLRNRQLLNYPFLRQRPVGNYIADFFCKPLRLIIEVDGETHEDPEVQAKDALKTQNLVQAGYTVLRFTDEEVMQDLDGVYAILEDFIAMQEAKNGAD